jgi:outer membrane protein assembly factor BamB
MRGHRTLAVLGACLLPGVIFAQGPPRGFWTVPGYDPSHTSWQKAETEITPDTVSKDFKFLWKLKLGNAAKASLSEPLLYPGLITGRGFKDLALLADGGTVYAVDSELGEVVWKKDFPSASGSKACGNIQIVPEAPQVIHFGAHRQTGSRPAAPPPSETPLPRDQRRVGAAPGGGYFGLRGVFVLTSDGYIHEQVMSTGRDYAPPVKWIAAPGGSSFGLNMSDKVVYTFSGSGCKNVPVEVWSIDLNTADYTVGNYKDQKFSLAGLSGPALGTDGTAYISTASGTLALDAGLKVKDSYSPSTAGKMLNAGPVVLTYKGKELIVAGGGGGSLVALDSQSLGGTDHHTPMAQTAPITKAALRGAWESLAGGQDKSGGLWVFASISGPVNPGIKFPNSNGPAPHGSLVAFKLEEQDGKMVLTPAWISRDLSNPAPPAIANGVVFALEGGRAHATLYALDAATGKQLYTSGDSITANSRLAGVSVGDGHVFFTTRDNTLYSFGIPMEH